MDQKSWSMMAIGAMVGAAIVYGLIQLSGPSTFDDCLLAGAKEAGSDLAFRAVAGVCRRKFPPVSPPLRSIPLEELEKYPGFGKD